MYSQYEVERAKEDNFFGGRMGKYSKLWLKILSGRSDDNIGFSELCGFLIRLGFTERIKGDHHIFTREDIDEIINIQPKRNKAKPYQIKQIRVLLVKYGIGGTDEDQV